MAPDSLGGAPNAIEGIVHMNSHDGVSSVTHVDAPLAINSPGMGLPIGSRLIWELELNGRRNGDWCLPFNTR